MSASTALVVTWCTIEDESFAAEVELDGRPTGDTMDALGEAIREHVTTEHPDDPPRDVSVRVIQ